jgi:hypothetical protein
MSPFSTIWPAPFLGERADFGMSGERRFVSPLARTTAQGQVHRNKLFASKGPTRGGPIKK